MKLSRKRQREFTKLKRSAEELLHDQKAVLAHASHLASDARRQASNYAREEVTPRVRTAYDDRVRPVVSGGVNATRNAIGHSRDKVVDDVIPSITTAIGTALAALEASKHPQVREAFGKVSKAATKAGIATPKSSSGPGKYILIGVGVVALAGIAYAAWQTLRADDDLWIDDEGDFVEVDQADVETPLESTL